MQQFRRRGPGDRGQRGGDGGRGSRPLRQGGRQDRGREALAPDAAPHLLESISMCVVNGRLRQAGEGAVRRACSARRNETPGGILPLRVCTVLPRGDPFVAVRTRDGHAAAGCVPHGIPDGRSASGFGRHAEAGIHRGIRVPRQTMDTTRRGRQVLANVVHVGLPEPARRLPPWRGAARAASP